MSAYNEENTCSETGNSMVEQHVHPLQVGCDVSIILCLAGVSVWSFSENNGHEQVAQLQGDHQAYLTPVCSNELMPY